MTRTTRSISGALAGSLLVATFGASTAAQSPSPDPSIPQQLCVTFLHSPGFVIGPDTLAEGLTSGDVVVTVVLPDTECGGFVTPTDEPFVDESVDNDLYLAYLFHQMDAQESFLGLSGDMLDALDTENWTRIGRAADKLVRWAKDEIEWLDKNEAAECYADDQADWREVVVTYRSGFVDLSWGAKHDGSKAVSRLERGIERMTDANDLLNEYNETDYPNEC